MFSFLFFFFKDFFFVFVFLNNSAAKEESTIDSKQKEVKTISSGSESGPNVVPIVEANATVERPKTKRETNDDEERVAKKQKTENVTDVKHVETAKPQTTKEDDKKRDSNSVTSSKPEKTSEPERKRRRIDEGLFSILR